MEKLVQKHGELLAQAQVRISICSFMGLYYLVFGVQNHPVYLAFVGYSVFLLLALKKVIAANYISPLATLIIDNGFAICGLHVTGESGTFLLFFLIHISFAYGIRFGHQYLLLSLLISCAGVAWLYVASVPWQGRIHFLLSFLFGMPFISVYVFSLNRKLQKSQFIAVKSTERTQNLLTFLTHDIRAPLQYILESANRLAQEPLTEKGQSAVRSINRLSNLMARMLKSVVVNDENERKKTNNRRKQSGVRKVFLSEWLIDFAEIYRDIIEEKHAQLTYEIHNLADSVPEDKIEILERIFSNVFSNAIKHCEEGRVLVKLDPAPAGSRSLRVAIENESIRGSSLESDGERVEVLPVDLISGWGLGLTAAREASESIGATFEFKKLTERTFCTCVEVQALEDFSSRSSSTVVPILVLTECEKDFNEKTAIFLGVANVYWIKTSQAIRGLPMLGREPVETIYICEADFAKDHGLGDASQEKFGPRIVIDSRQGAGRFLIESDEVHISSIATIDEWKHALRLAEALLISKRAKSAVSRRAKGSMRGKRILALDDNVFNLAILDSSLSKLGLTLVTVATSADAERELRQNQYDIFLVDWNLGARTAEGLLVRLLKNAKFARTKFIVLSAGHVVFHDRSLKESGKIITLLKPVDAQHLHDVIANLEGSVVIPPEETIAPPESIFNTSNYYELGMTEDTVRLAKTLLAEFLLTIRRAMNAMQVDDGMPSAHQELNFHQLASMCYSAGAYALGDEFRKIDEETSFSTNLTPLKLPVSQFAYVQRLFNITNAHICCFLYSLNYFSAVDDNK